MKQVYWVKAYECKDYDTIKNAESSIGYSRIQRNFERAIGGSSSLDLSQAV